MGFLYEDYNFINQRHEGMLAYCYATCKKDAVRKLAGMEDNNRSIVNKTWTPLDPNTGVRKQEARGYATPGEPRLERPKAPF